MTVPVINIAILEQKLRMQCLNSFFARNSDFWRGLLWG